MIKTPSLPSGYAIYCDDIRYEVSGKRILVGVYNSELLSPASYPLELPLLCVEVNFLIPTTTPAQTITPFLTIDTNSNSQILAEMPIEWPGEPADAEMPEAYGDVAMRFVVLSSIFQMRDVLVSQASGIRAKVRFGDDEYRLGYLGVKGEVEGISQPV